MIGTDDFYICMSNGRDALFKAGDTLSSHHVSSCDVTLAVGM